MAFTHRVSAENVKKQFQSLILLKTHFILKQGPLAFEPGF